MRIQRRANWLHPVLRSGADDFPAGKIETNVRTDSRGTPTLHIRFHIDQDTVEKALASGRAQCAAMVYCARTLFRRTVVADPGRRSLTWALPTDELTGTVTIHPFVFWREANQEWPDAHNDYKAYAVRAPRFSPLAVDSKWTFDVDHEPPPPVTSIFSVKTNPDLAEGELDVDIDLSDRFLTVRCHSRQETALKGLPTYVRQSSVLLGILVEALAEMRADGCQPSEQWHDDGWARCLWRQLKKAGLILNDEGGVTLFRAAHTLLERPFSGLVQWVESVSEGHHWRIDE